MKSANTSVIAGVILIALGVLLLLDRLGVMDTAAFTAPLIFTAVGVLFLSLFIRRRENWWAAIPGSVFLGLAAVVAATQLTGGAWGLLSCSFSWVPDSRPFSCASVPTGGH
ncbi:hypothetical protein PV772_17885 [Pseudarthrobacter sp. CC12]|uniref:hypothetical protein n=1 Tax=unclassified Pseudarthrobacter TaxID=2647000 RepID=UPI001FF05533|nr:hypothetical protein [Pseudarthrobacter sp. NIBRBAC000502771]